MLSAMRRNLKTLSIALWVVIAAFIGTTFLVWGKGSITGNDPSAVATVNGEEVSLAAYQRRYRNYLDFYRQLYKERFTPELAEKLGVSQQVLNDLIQESLIRQRARKEGVRVGDQELRERIQAMKAFQENGAFSRDRYLRLLNQAKVDPATFEEDQRGEFLRRKVEAIVKDGVKVSEAELRSAYMLRKEQIRAAWLLVEIEPLKAKAQVSEEELQSFLKDHQAEFRRPERRRVQYVLATPGASQVPVTDQEVETYYKEHLQEFERPRRVRPAHILVRVPPVGGSEAETKAKAKLEAALKRIKAGTDFAQVAREISEDPGSAPNGGDLGFVQQGELVPQFEQAALALKKGEVTPEPIRTAFGYHLIKLLDAQAAGRRPLKDVAREVREKLQNERADRAARAKLEEARPLLLGAKDFREEARRAALTAREALLAKGEPLEGVGRSSGIEEAIFGLSIGGTSAVLKAPTGYLVLRVTEELPAAVPPLAEIKALVADAVKRQKAESLARERAVALTKTIESGDLATVAKREGLPSGDTGFFSRSEPPADKSLSPEVIRPAFALESGKASQPIQTPKGVYLVKVMERHPPELAGFEKGRTEIERQLLEEKRNQVWEAYVAALRAEAKIQILGQTGPLP
ncbi:MAG TPA: peptidyl-prolyl cis-trans isomerase [Methylomirabilota bacterium]|nr:peptidyl-prolyl cis-trans isomerase [Methylomirabilota bacterium]